MGELIRFSREQIVWQEVPGEVSLAYTISGCPLRCKGCHSRETRNPRSGEPLRTDYFHAELARYSGLITCVLFLGGEWQLAQLQHLLRVAQTENLHTCLYTGLASAPPELLPYLTYIKTGPWIADRGGLDNPATNQRFIDLRTNELLNYKFHHQPSGYHHAAT